MPTFLPSRTPDRAIARHLASLAIALAVLLLVEMTIRTPPLAGEAVFGGYGDVSRAAV